MKEPMTFIEVRDRLENKENPLDLSIEKWERLASRTISEIGNKNLLGGDTCACCLIDELCDDESDDFACEHCVIDKYGGCLEGKFSKLWNSFVRRNEQGWKKWSTLFLMYLYFIREAEKK